MGVLLSRDLLRRRLRLLKDRSGAVLEVVENEQPDCRRQVALLAAVVDFTDQLRQRHVAQTGNFFHAVPEGLFQADAGLVAGDDDRSLNDWRFHGSSSWSIRCWSSISFARLVRFSSADRSALVRPNRVRLASACFAETSR